jgi:AMMECR1 domain-containing protein
MSTSACGDIEANTAMCGYCFDILSAHFDNIDIRQLPLIDASNNVSVGGMFVTLNIIDSSSKEKQLRGCIGRLSELLLNDMSNYVLMSAFKDSRFPPLTIEELPHLEVAISLLIKYEPASNYLDWEVRPLLESGWIGLLSSYHVPCLPSTGFISVLTITITF